MAQPVAPVARFPLVNWRRLMMTARREGTWCGASALLILLAQPPLAIAGDGDAASRPMVLRDACAPFPSTVCDTARSRCSAETEHATRRGTTPCAPTEVLGPQWRTLGDLETVDVATAVAERGGETGIVCLRLLQLPGAARAADEQKEKLLRLEERRVTPEQCSAERSPDWTGVGRLSVAGHYIISVRPELATDDVRRLLRPLGGRVVRQIARRAIYEIVVADDLRRATRSPAVDSIRRHPSVVAFAPALILHSPMPRPDITAQGSLRRSCRRQWHLEKVEALKAQALSTCATGPIVAVIDTRIRRSHPELVSSIWLNPREIGDDARVGHDDDSNDFVDDVAGWDFIDDDCDVEDADKCENERGHGTAVAGIIAATPRDARGASGICPGAKIMTIRAMKSWPRGSTEVLDIVESIYYATDNGAKVINLSLGGSCSDDSLCNPADLPQLEHAIKEAGRHDVLVVASAGNKRQDIGESPSYPASFEAPNLIAVAASDCDDLLWSNSGFGRDRVHLAAPGRDVYSAYDSNSNPCSHFAQTGTSFAAALVSGAALAVIDRFGPLSPEQIRAHLMRTADKIDSLRDKVACGGRLNVFRALCECPKGLPPARCPVCPSTLEFGESTAHAGTSTLTRSPN